MHIIIPSFAYIYKNLLQNLIKRYPVKIAPRNLSIKYELINHSLCFDPSYISIYSEKTSKAFPINFALAELCWILNGSDHTHQMLKPLDKYSTNNILTGAYGARLHRQIPMAINKLIHDIDSRQCVLSIYRSADLLSPHSDTPCNTQLQFLIRDSKLIMIITSRSSDILTGLPIDAFQWQCLYHLFLNELNDIMGKNVIATGLIHYNIGSLHMYAADIPMYKAFTYADTSKKFEHKMHIYQTYTNARDRAITKFSTAKKIEHLLEIVDIGSFTQINKLTTIFKNRTHKISRDNM